MTYRHVHQLIYPSFLFHHHYISQPLRIKHLFDSPCLLEFCYLIFDSLCMLLE